MKNKLQYSKGSEALGQRLAAGSSADSSIDASELFLPLTESLKQVEEIVRESITSDAKLLSEISLYLLELGGKRIRPILCSLTSRLFSQPELPKELLIAAAGIELIHMATLLHDDIIDQSLIRRHSESAFSRFGQTPTLLTGDFLLVKAFGLCADLDPYIIKQTERACIELTEGELLEGHISTERKPDFDEYIDIVQKKTASLFALAAELAAFSCAPNKTDVATMRQFGLEAGTLFQMVDDVLDISADKNLLGKPGGVDLKQKVPTLVNVVWLELEPLKAQQFFSKTSYSVEEINQTRAYLTSSPVFTRCMEHIYDYLQTAKNTLTKLESKNIDSKTLEKLERLMVYTINRIPNIEPTN